MKLISVNIGLPSEVAYQGRRITTGIFKVPADGAIPLRYSNLDGDGQADLRVHGGADKAVYAYPVEHYAYWSGVLQRDAFEYGQFGENFTTQGLLEETVCIGDIHQVGEAVVQVSQPRTPCFKLDLRMGIDGFHTRFSASRRTGFYLRVLQEGRVAAGDELKLVEKAAECMSVYEIFALRHGDGDRREHLARAAQLPALAASWRAALEKKLERSAGE